MNKKVLIDKQALIETLEELKKNSKRCIGIDWRGKTVAYFNLIGLVKQLNESQKPVMPKFFDDWAKQVLEKRDKFYAISLITRAGWGYGVDFELNYDRSPSGTKELLNWIVENEGDDYPNKKKAVEALLHGYEVEKEPLYYVKLPVVYFNHLDLETYLMKDDRGNITIADNNDFDDMKFTESEIKAIDERYWAFAVPVEEVAI
ncbi:DUF1642 domain-containing protein [Enterococcus faecium]|uniref:DUF1642 domain-containing protein n=1 Tax=Enterococcus faecium TaxID=1352 RepID=UPI001EDEE577|nr:DUF1642 domain-containing protein [Enterococcus faecium]MCG4569924.1 DUF1642 domain-containing protein [Enterococcus faecium]